jgi:radical SAM superfamily enzyme YgiQ (UPF0313 family)
MCILRDNAGGMGTAVRSRRPTYGHDDNYFVIPYLSLINCAAILKEKGYDISFLNAQIEKLDIDKVLDYVKKIQPDIMITVINLPSIFGDLNLLAEIKASCSRITIIAIGSICKIFPDLILNNKAIDFLLLGDPEVTIEESIKCIRGNNNNKHIPGIAFHANGSTFISNHIPLLDDLDSIPLPPYDLISIEKYWAPPFGRGFRCAFILTSKGCNFPCQYYCPYPHGFGKKVRFRNPSRVVKEIQFLQERYKIERVLFRDQVFTFNYYHSQQICQELINRNIKINWLCETRLDLVDRKLLELMKKAGCIQINYGLESGDPQLFSNVGKPSRYQLEELRDIILMTKDVGIKAHTHLIIGLPGENWRTIKNTLKTLKEWRPDSIQVNIVTPYPGTQLYEDAKQRGLILTTDLSKYTGNYPVLRTEQMSLKKLVRAQKYVHNKFYGTTLGKRLITKIRRLLRNMKVLNIMLHRYEKR